MPLFLSMIFDIGNTGVVKYCCEVFFQQPVGLKTKPKKIIQFKNG